MKTKLHNGTGRRVPVALAALATGGGVLTLLYPGGLGEAGPVRVTDGASASVFRTVNRVVADAPSWSGSLLEAVADGVLVVLGLLLIRTGWTARRRRDVGTLAGVVLAVDNDEPSDCHAIDEYVQAGRRGLGQVGGIAAQAGDGTSRA